MERTRHTADHHKDALSDPDRVRAMWLFEFVQDDGFDILECYTCPCGSTLSLRGIGPVLEETK